MLCTALQVVCKWLRSGTWPLPHRPRVRATGSWVVEADPTNPSLIRRIEEKWDSPLLGVVIPQTIPRFWDVWHLYMTPPAEKPLYRVLRKYSGGLELREYFPRLVLEAQAIDSRPNQQFTDFVGTIPPSVFTDELQLAGKSEYRETYVTTSPLEIAVESYDWTPPPEAKKDTTEPIPSKRVLWTMPMPSHLGLSTSKLPVPISEPNHEEGEKGRHVVQGKRLVAVRTFKGTPQNEQYKNARKDLLALVKKEGLETVRTSKGRSRVWVYRNDMKLGFNLQGHLSIAHWEQKMYTDNNEIAVEVLPPQDLR